MNIRAEGAGNAADASLHHADPMEQPETSLGLAAWLKRHNVSIALSCYQHSLLFLIGATPQGEISLSAKPFGRAMGLARRQSSIYIGAVFQLWRLENLLRPGEISSRTYEAVYVPRLAYTIGHLDIHEIGVLPDGKPLFVNTRYNCLASVDPVHCFRATWKPFFISEIADGDRCHLNGLAMDKGRPRFVTALGRSDEVQGWRRHAERGLLIDVERNRIVRDDLLIPHSPRVQDGQLYLLESGRGMLVRVDLRSGVKSDVCYMPGFVRGLSFHDNHALVTISKWREDSFDGLPIEQENQTRGLQPWCGVAVIDLARGEIVEWIKMKGEIISLFDVLALPGIRCPLLLGPRPSELDDAVTFDVSALPRSNGSARGLI